eukprot:TRINITY_DN1136_c0_g2_i1.p1 TRINITY_DN1136_c0_g2~~TRINITY_DN1136_c0_g2_i1.p1  ORF type:complete len:187 (-),score=49.63 TRINITY_DN1136_c0_g2_i1:63-623(-)
MQSYEPMSDNPSLREVESNAMPRRRFRPLELLFFRSYQLPAIAACLYYCSFPFALFVVINAIVACTSIWGVGGAFLGLFTGLVTALLIILGMRLFTEVAVSVYEIRNNSSPRSHHEPALTFSDPRPSVPVTSMPSVAPAAQPTSYMPTEAYQAAPAGGYQTAPAAVYQTPTATTAFVPSEGSYQSV